jgi:YHS domain-containing protein
MTTTIMTPEIIAWLRERERFLLPRLNADELGLYDDSLLGMPQKPLVAIQAGLADEERDPVCGTRLAPADDDIGYEYQSHHYHFRTASRRERFRRVARP